MSHRVGHRCSGSRLSRVRESRNMSSTNEEFPFPWPLCGWGKAKAANRTKSNPRNLCLLLFPCFKIGLPNCCLTRADGESAKNIACARRCQLETVVVAPSAFKKNTSSAREWVKSSNTRAIYAGYRIELRPRPGDRRSLSAARMFKLLILLYQSTV